MNINIDAAVAAQMARVALMSEKPKRKRKRITVAKDRTPSFVTQREIEQDNTDLLVLSMLETRQNEFDANNFTQVL